MKPRSQRLTQAERNPLDEQDSDEPSLHHVFVKTGSALEDYLDEEVVDRSGKPLGTLTCYWEDGDGLLVFCGVHVQNADDVRVVPGSDLQVSERHSWVRVNYPRSVVSKAPAYDCDEELNAEFERRVFEHYGMTDALTHDRLKYLSSRATH